MHVAHGHGRANMTMINISTVFICEILETKDHILRDGNVGVGYVVASISINRFPSVDNTYFCGPAVRSSTYSQLAYI